MDCFLVLLSLKFEFTSIFSFIRKIIDNFRQGTSEKKIIRNNLEAA